MESQINYERIDAIISQLQSPRVEGLKNHVDLNYRDIIYICKNVQTILLDQPSLLYLCAPINIVGKLNGNYQELLRIFEYKGCPPDSTYLFLGNFTGDGKYNVETTCLLLSYKLRYPDHIYILRGANEGGYTSISHGLLMECRNRYDTKTCSFMCKCLTVLPFAAVVDETIFCVSSGLSPSMTNISQIDSEVARPCDIQGDGIHSELLFTRYLDQDDEWALEPNRGTNIVFGNKAIQRFLKDYKFDMIITSNIGLYTGIEMFANDQLVCIYSDSNANNSCNMGSILTINDDLSVESKTYSHPIKGIKHKE